MIIKIPIKLPSPNIQEHWSKRSKRNNLLKILIRSELNKLKEKPKIPSRITITRIAPRPYDYDNLVASCKGLTDRIAEALIPGLPPGHADGDMRLQFVYEQKKGVPRENAIEIQFKHIWPDAIIL